MNQELEELQPARATEMSAVEVGQADNQITMIVQMLDKAMSQDVSPEVMEKYLDLYERVQAKQAEREFWAAFHTARAEMPVIGKRGINKSTDSAYALLEDIKSAIEPIYSRHGFSIMFSTDVSPKEEHTRILALIAHIGGHSIERHTDLPLDDVGMKGTKNKTPMHATGSAHTYGERYLLKLIWNLTITNNPLDDDGNGSDSGYETINDNQCADLMALMDEVKADEDAFIEYFNIPKISALPASQFKKAVSMLEKKR